MPFSASIERLISTARALRDFGDGFIAVTLPVYLTAIGLGAFEIGIVATAGLLGSALITLAIGRYATRTDPRQLLIAAAGLMTLTGIAFAVSDSYVAILLIAFFGTINPSAGSVSIFVPLEHTLLSGVTSDKDRTHMFARYSLVGAFAAALGALAAGIPDVTSRFGLSQDAALRGMLLFYAALGLGAAFVYAQCPPAPKQDATGPVAALGPSKAIVYKLAALFSIDSFAGGFVVQSLVALWLFSTFGLSLAAAGLFFFCSSLLAAFSFPVAAWLASRIGLINTMVFTHIPANICMILAAVSPRVDVAIALLLVRATLSQMDVPTRSSYVMAVVTPAERPAAASLTSVPRSLAAALSPAIAGALFAAGYQAWPLILCGTIKIGYDIALLWTFRHVKPPEERSA